MAFKESDLTRKKKSIAASRPEVKAKKYSTYKKNKELRKEY